MLDELVGADDPATGDTLGVFAGAEVVDGSTGVLAGAEVVDGSAGVFAGAEVADGSTGVFVGAEVVDVCGGLSQEATLLPNNDPRPPQPSEVTSFGQVTETPLSSLAGQPVVFDLQLHSHPFKEAYVHS
jgi:hypothetical protein